MSEITILSFLMGVCIGAVGAMIYEVEFCPRHSDKAIEKRIKEAKS